jgi:hypothetical protein
MMEHKKNLAGCAAMTAACSCQWWGPSPLKAPTNTQYYTSLDHVDAKKNKINWILMKNSLAEFCLFLFCHFLNSTWFSVLILCAWLGFVRSLTLFCLLLLCIWQISLHQHLKDYIYVIYT